MKPEQFLKILKKIEMAPTPDNSQGFRFSNTGKDYFLHVDKNRTKHFFNPDEQSYLVAAGVLLEHVRNESLKIDQDFTVEFPLMSGHRFPLKMNFSAADHKAKLQIVSESIINSRLTYRHPFDFESDESDLKRLKETLESSGNCKVVLKSDPLFLKLSNRIRKSDSIFWHCSRILRDTFLWIRWSRSEYQRRNDGFHFQELGASAMDVPALWLIQKWPFLGRFLYPFLYPLIDWKLKRCLESSEGFLLVYSDSKRSSSREFDLGKTTIRLWWKLTEFGRAVQPHSLMSYFLFLELPKGENSEESKTYGRLSILRQEMSDLVQLSDGQNFWLLRFGRVPKTAKILPRMRRPIPFHISE